MKAIVQRGVGLLGRWRVDRRLPPSVKELFIRSAQLRREDAAHRIVADRRPMLEATSGEGAFPVRRASQRLAVVAALPDSLDTLGLATASTVVEALEAAGIELFLTARRGDGLEFGLSLDDRQAAAEILSRQFTGAWYIVFLDGAREGIVALSDVAGDRRAMRAREWNVFQAFAWGDRAIGETAGCRLTFWTPGDSGQMEKVGTRAQARFLGESARTIEVVRGVEFPGRAAFPVGANFECFDDPVDIVYTWVDGADSEWQRDFAKWKRGDGREQDHTAFDMARFTSRDELRFSLRSIWAYCGWVRRIYVVTCGQVPEWFVEDDRIRIVRHEEILPATALPTFNSHAIEAALHRIDGLAEHFIYLNDDMCIARSLRPEAFFTSNGLAKVFQSDALVPGSESDSTIAVDTGAIRGRELLRERFGRVVSGKPFHAPYPLRRSVMEQVERDFPDIVDRTMHSRFRAASDLSIAASFAQHYGLALGFGVLGEIAAGYAHVESGRLSVALSRIELAHDLDAFCLNETHHSSGDHTERERRIAEFFERVFPVSAPWEK